MSGDIVVLGSLVVDRKFHTEEKIRVGPNAPAQNLWRTERHPGGVGRNVAVNLARLGDRPLLAALTGFGADAAWLEDGLTDLGVRLGLVPAADGIGRCDIWLDERGNQYALRIALPDPPATRALRGPALAGHIEGASALVTEGGLDEDLLVWASERAASRGVPVVCLPTRLWDVGPRAHLLPLYDVLVLNAREADALVGRPGGAGEQAVRLLRRGPRTVVVTCGADGAVLAQQGWPEPVLLPAPTGPCRDDTGAGDALAAGFVSGLVAGCGPRAALVRGLTAAGRTLGCPLSACRALGGTTTALKER